MKKILFFLILYNFTEYSVAQSLSPQLISSSGSTFSDGSNQLEWSLGEPITTELTDGSNIMTQGFHQVNLSITSIDNLDSNYGITLFPNPTVDLIQIKFEQFNENNSIELYNAEGMLLLKQLSDYKMLCQIDMSNFNSGIYFVKFCNKYSKGKSYRIVKLK